MPLNVRGLARSPPEGSPERASSEKYTVSRSLAGVSAPPTRPSRATSDMRWARARRSRTSRRSSASIPVAVDRAAMISSSRRVSITAPKASAGLPAYVAGSGTESFWRAPSGTGTSRPLVWLSLVWLSEPPGLGCSWARGGVLKPVARTLGGEGSPPPIHRPTPMPATKASDQAKAIRPFEFFLAFGFPVLRGRGIPR